MASRTPQFRLDDGTAVVLSVAEAVSLYDELWSLVGAPGALSAAAKVMELRKRRVAYPAEWLDAHESEAMRLALANMNASVAAG